MRRWSLSVALGLGCFVGGAGAVNAQSVTAVPKLDVNKLSVGWYEIARLPNKSEKACVSNAQQIYAPSNKAVKLQVVDSCLLKDGEANARNVTAKLDKEGDGKLKVGSFFLFASKEWVLASAPDWNWVLIGSPNHKLLWVLSRKEKMDAGVLQQIEAMATAQGFDTAKLEMVPQGK